MCKRLGKIKVIKNCFLEIQQIMKYLHNLAKSAIGSYNET